MTKAEKAQAIALHCLVSALIDVVCRDADAREDFEAAVKRHMEPHVASGEIGSDAAANAPALLRPRKRTRQEEAQAAEPTPQADDLWHSIETAPRDGSLFDVWTAQGHRITMVCTVFDEQWPHGALVHHDNVIGATVAITDATHWRPLPQPPEHARSTPRV